jgi:hypothetical protein
MKYSVACAVLLLLASCFAQSTYTIAGIDKRAAANGDVISVSGSFAGATTSNARCQFTVQPVNYTLSITGSPSNYFVAPQIVTNSIVTCVVSLSAFVNSLVSVNVVATGVTNATAGTNSFVYTDSSIVVISEEFNNMNNVDCGTSLPNSIGCPGFTQPSGTLTVTQTIPSSPYVNRTVVRSTSVGEGASKENYVDFTIDATSSGDGQYVEVWQHSTSGSVSTSLETSGVNSNINIVLTTATQFVVAKAACAFANATLYRLMVRITAPANNGTTYTVRGDLITIPSFTVACTAQTTVPNFPAANFYATKPTVAVSMSNAIYTAGVTTPANSASLTATGSANLVAKLVIDRMLAQCQFGDCSITRTPSSGGSSTPDTTLNPALQYIKLNPIPIIVICVVLAVVAVLGVLCCIISILCRRRKKKVKPSDKDKDKESKSQVEFV